jgi:hypothetical protein
MSFSLQSKVGRRSEFRFALAEQWLENLRENRRMVWADVLPSVASFCSACLQAGIVAQRKLPHLKVGATA